MAKNTVVKYSIELYCLHQLILVYAAFVEFHSRVKISRSLLRLLHSTPGGAKRRDKMIKMCKPFLHSDWLLRCVVVAAPESPGISLVLNNFFSILSMYRVSQKVSNF